MRHIPLLASLTLLLTLPSLTFAAANPIDEPEFSLSIGYANVSVGNSSSELHSLDAIKFDPVFSFTPIMTLPQLRLGVSPNVSVVLDNSSHLFIIHNGSLTVIGNSDVPFVLFQPEARISWRQPLGESQQFFLEPGLGFGGAFGWLDIDSDNPSVSSIHESASTWEARAFLYAGMQVTGGTAGLEFSYMRGGNMDFADNAHGDVNEFYIGLFGAF